ncbi:MAG: hypothetical protein AB4041_18020 [Microcystaceae cyanobacterium]
MIRFDFTAVKQAIAILTVWFLIISPSFAFPEGMIISADNNQVNIYPQPNQEQPAIATGNVGDTVMLLETAYNNQGEMWDHVRLMLSPQIEGWINDSYLQKETIEQPSDNPYDPKNYYQLNQFQ